MSIIVFASSKGGAGKTTSAFILATELSDRGLRTHVIDADPNHPIAKWSNGGGRSDKLSITPNDSEETLLDDIDNASKNADIVIVDLEGTANLSVAYAISKADLVIIPSQRSALDAEEAARAVALVKRQSNVIGRQIAVSVLLTRTSSAIRSKGLKRMVDSLEKNKIDSFSTEIHEREAYKVIFDHKVTLSQILSSQVGGLDKARSNAANFAAETLRKIQEQKPAREVAA
jgi:chromosome partitioning protein